MKFNTNTPEKSGTFTVVYCRAKSAQEVIGTAKYTTRGRNKGWSNIVNSRTGRTVNPSIEYSRIRNGIVRIVEPTVVAWSN